VTIVGILFYKHHWYDLHVAAKTLARNNKNTPEEDWNKLKCVLRYCKAMADMEKAKAEKKEKKEKKS
jgi:hypothetical protein